MLIFKVIVLGDSGVGKTTFVKKFVDKKFLDDTAATIGVEFDSKIISIQEMIKPELRSKYEAERNNYIINVDDEYINKLKMQIWGCSGQERFNSIIKSYYRDVMGAIFVCDLTNHLSLIHLKKWIDDFDNTYTGTLDLTEVSKIIVATKSDLINNIVVNEAELRVFAEKIQVPYFIVSSKTDNVDHIFSSLVNEMFSKYLCVPAKDISRKRYIASEALKMNTDVQLEIKSCYC